MGKKTRDVLHLCEVRRNLGFLASVLRAIRFYTTADP